jgi:hypothetical protein
MKFLVLIVLVSCTPHDCKTVKSIGGCNEDTCGVSFTDGTFSSLAVAPVVGAKMCIYPSGNYVIGNQHD